MSTTTWVIAKTKPGPSPSGKPYTSYWTDTTQVIGGFAYISPWTSSLGPPHHLTGAIRTFPSKQEAKAAYRDVYSTFSRDLAAIELTAEQSALVTPTEVDDGEPYDYADDLTADTTGATIGPQEDAEAVIPAPAVLAVPAVTGEMTAEAARALTDEIKADAEALWDKLATAYTERAWAALGYASWDAYCSTEFASVRLRLQREERQDVVCSLRESGLSIRAIAAGVGIDAKTVQTDIKSGVGNSHTSAERERRLIEDAVANRSVTGTDGKQYPAQPKRKPYEPTSEEGRLRVVTATVRRMEHIADEVAKIVNDTATHPREDDGPLRTRMADAAYQISDAAEHLRVAIPYSPTQLPKLPTPEALAIIGREWTKQLTGTVAKTMDDDGMVYLSIERVTQIAEFMTAAAALLEKQR